MEVTIAIGIASFALLGIYGLVPVGYQSLKRSDDRMASSLLFESLSQLIREARPATNGTYRIAGPFADSALGNASWQVGGGKVTLPVTKVGEIGNMESGSAGRYVVAGQILPPSTSGEAGQARLSVAWPATATFDPANLTWNNAAGFQEVTLYFLPKSL